MARPSIPLEKALAATCVAALSACQPTVRVEAPDKPIEINLNVTIQQEVLVKLQRDVEQLIQENPEAFPQQPQQPQRQ